MRTPSLYFDFATTAEKLDEDEHLKASLTTSAESESE
jgi:hypothetical protein